LPQAGRIGAIIDRCQRRERIGIGQIAEPVMAKFAKPVLEIEPGTAGLADE
jgi:hypothetical protein